MEIYGFDAFSPKEIAGRVKDFSVIKARLPLLTLWMLGMLAGAFIGLGALYFTLVVSDASLGFAAARVAGGVCFSLGLLLVVVAGAELFTGNIVGGSVMVALVYWVIYLRGRPPGNDAPRS